MQRWQASRDGLIHIAQYTVTIVHTNVAYVAYVLLVLPIHLQQPALPEMQ